MSGSSTPRTVSPSAGAADVLRIATWNLERPRIGSVRRVPGLHARLASVGADVWVLTETNVEAIDLSATHPHVMHTRPVPGLHARGERWTAIHSRWPLEHVPARDPDVSVCARVATPIGPLLVYGTVLPYHADGVVTRGARTWTEFHRVIPLERAAWARLRTEFPAEGLCLAGDLNQSLDGRRWQGREWYGTRATRAALGSALADCGLTCVTAHDLVASGHLTTRSSIDHICLDRALAGMVRAVGAWEAGEGDGERLSDHNGVWADRAG